MQLYPMLDSQNQKKLLIDIVSFGPTMDSWSTYVFLSNYFYFLQLMEDLEQLKVIEHGYKIKVGLDDD